MILEIAAILGAAIAIGIAFWDEMLEWVNDCIETAKKMLPGILQGVKVFIQKMAECAKEISRLYSKEGNRWIEKTDIKYVSESEVPEDIRKGTAYMERKEVDITEKLKMQMS